MMARVRFYLIGLCWLSTCWFAYSFVPGCALAASPKPTEWRASASSVTLPVTSTLPAQVYLPLIGGAPPSRLLITGAYIDSILSGEPDEAILLWNAGSSSQPLAGW